MFGPGTGQRVQICGQIKGVTSRADRFGQRIV
jgi:hypothetical protein